jgi:UDP-N-acetylmuramoyl-L-alanyl-D-glutamate--2,6-diaminopimelate ligase
MTPQPSLLLAALITRLPQARLRGDLNTVVRGITHDSRCVKPGDLFVCLAGAAHDGHRYAAQAVSGGAAALLVNECALENLGISLPDNIAIVTVPDTRAALPLAACALFGDPSHALTMIGVTGTNGKTTTTRMIASILRAAGKRVGTIGTLGTELDGMPIPSEHTTPEADQLQALLATMRDAGADAVVMEVSSHALAQHRTGGIAFSAAVFTNLTQDHLDFHQTMDEYFRAKAQLFTDYPVLYPRPDGGKFIAAINSSAWKGTELASTAQGDVITFGPEESAAMLRSERVRLGPESADFDAVWESDEDPERFPVCLPVGGAFQVGNALAAIAVCMRLRVPVKTIAEGFAQLSPVPGRFEAVRAGDRGFTVIVDYAHTPDGLENLLRSARELDPARILLVFGCGGNRDRTKRPIMGRLAATLADIAVVTSDNPRHEAPGEIIDEILAGMKHDARARAEILVEPDRRAAIGLALSQVRRGDIVLIAGKGHEDYQIVGDQTLSFDDRQVARDWLEGRAN